MRIGILGGTFNPIHNGHLALARAAASKLRLDKIIFIPTYRPPHKNVPLAPARHRHKLVTLAIKGRAKFCASRMEINRKGKSYTIETLQLLRKRFGPKAEMFFIAGADSLKELRSWYKIGKVLKLAHFVIVARPGYSLKRLPGGLHRIGMRPVRISSTEIRTLIKAGCSIKRLVPKPVAAYIKRKKLYA